jgi:hypothetical protein
MKAPKGCAKNGNGTNSDNCRDSDKRRNNDDNNLLPNGAVAITPK